MKNSNYPTKVLHLILCALITTLSASDIFAQEKIETELTEFLIMVQTSNSNKIEMVCKEGCAWKELTFSLSDSNKAKAIDESGMADLENVSPRQDSKLSNFLFTIVRTEKGVSLKGIEGTAWTDLSFSFSSKKAQAINQMGMTKK